MLTLLPDLYAPTWDPQRPSDNWLDVVTVDEALDRRYDTDALVLPYFVEQYDSGRWQWLSWSPRLQKAHLQAFESSGFRLRFRFGILDIDDRDAHRRDTETTPEWLHQAHATIDRLVPGAALYDTRRGVRVLWRLPVDLGPDQYEEELRRARRVFTESGLPPDACPWNQAMRVPRGVRDGVPQDRYVRNVAPPVWSPPAPPAVGQPAPNRVSTQGREAPTTVERFTLPDRVPQGERHDVLKRLAASLRAQGLARDEIMFGLQEADARVCDPPVGATAAGLRELEQLADYYGALPGGRSETFRTTPQTVAFEAQGIVPFARGDARELAERVLTVLEEPTRGHGPDGGTVPMVNCEGKMYVYQADTGLWKHIDRDTFHAKIMEFAGHPVESGVDKQGQPKFRPLRLRAADAIDAVKSVYWSRAKPDFFERAPTGIVLGSEFVRVSAEGKIERLPLSPDWRCRVGYDFGWTDEEPTTWAAFQHQLFDPHGADEAERMIRFVSEACGAGLIGIAPRYAKAIVFLGDGANGKSAALFIIEACYPENTVSSLAPHQFKNEGYTLAELVGKRLNLCSEISATLIDSKAAADLKLAIRGERMTVRRIYETPFDFRPGVLVIGALNALPRVQDTSTGFFRSWAALPFLRKFEPAEQDVTLPKRIVAVDRQRIVCSWLRAAADLVARGHYVEPTVSQETVRDWRKGLDPILQFVDDALEADETGSSHETIFQGFRNWCQRSGYAEIDKATFARRFADPARAKFGAKFAGPKDRRQKVYLCRVID